MGVFEEIEQFLVAFAFDEIHIGVDHHGYQLLEADFGLPAEFLFGLGRIAHQQIDFGGAVISRVEIFCCVIQSPSGAGGCVNHVSGMSATRCKMPQSSVVRWH